MSDQSSRGILYILGFVLAVLAFAAYRFNTWSVSPVQLSEEAIVEFPPGTKLVDLSGVLESKGVVKQALSFHLWVKAKGVYPKFQAGTYLFKDKVSPNDVIEAMMKGEVYRPVVLQFTIPEGYNLSLIAQRLAERGLGEAPEILAIMKNPATASSLGVPGPTLEGYLYPATYSYNHEMTLREVLKDMVGTFFKNLPAEYESRARKLGLALGEAVTFASLIELETIHDEERGMISEVIWKRLKNRSPLGIDAALIYGIKNYKGDITWNHLKDSKNPYNTRLRKGLPPTPIGSPSAASLEAVLNPTEKGYYYYVLNGDGQKKHHFSQTLAEHNQHVKVLLKETKNKQ
ncbi:MAG: endolytic transglycosylase MltG [Oligoflexales bacterium]